MVSTCYLTLILSIHHSWVLPLKTILVSGTWRTHAVLTVELTAASGISRVCCQVSLAGIVRDSLLEREFVHICRLPAVATVPWAQTVHNHLWRQCPVLQVVGHDVRAVGQGRGGALGPARPAVLGDVLLFGPG